MFIKIKIENVTMAQISFKIPDEEMKFLYWWSKKSGNPISSIYRNITLDLFKEWKIEVLLKEYQKGIIGFKQFCNLSGMSFNEASLLMQTEDIEPPISALIDEYTSKIREKLIKTDIIKSGKEFKRKTPEIDLPEPQ
ncbi:MAG: hypothetical protein HeimC3_46550 [Candidatus Heimdallarchaeota archaeon LC_3]|nr:MAG: hypothetical protein HeimC3_46550 [Candidatus Heimdallarchaeota archaeon LC_3]